MSSVLERSSNGSAGDAESLVVTLFNAEAGRLVQLARFFVDDRTAAEDLVQETYLRWQKQDAAKIDTPKAWLVATLTRLGRSLLAGNGRYPALQSILQLAAIVATWIWFARGEPGRERFVRSAAIAVLAYVALGKVLSPQYMIWLIPLVPLVWGRRGLYASGLFALACVLTQTWFPYRYWVFALHFDPLASWTVLVRDLVLVALLALLAWPAGWKPRIRTS